MAKMRGNPANTRGFFVSSRGRKPNVVTKSTVTKPNSARRRVTRVEAAPRVGVFRQ